MSEIENKATEAAQTDGAAQEEEGYRVYIGNLSFTTTEEGVREFVTKASDGEIISITLPKKFNRRPGGFAFVLYKNEDDAKKVVAELQEKELDGRKLSLEIARSKEEQAARREAIVEKRNAERAERTAVRAGQTDGEATEGEGKPKRKGSKPRRRTADEGDEEATGDATLVEGEAKPKSTRKARKPQEGRIDEAEGEEKKPRERKPRLQLTGEQSESTIFVANLPFNLDDEALAAIFTNLSIRVKSAKVIRGLRKGRGGRPFRASKGFGFVEVEDPTQQKEAVDKVEGSLIGDRKISAKIANEMKPIEAEEVAEVNGGAEPVAAA